jgi:hypothetical protein
LRSLHSLSNLLSPHQANWRTFFCARSQDKAKAKKDKLFVKRLVNWSSGFFLVTFLGIMIAIDTAAGGSYAVLWMLILFAAFQVGSRKLRASMAKPGEDEPKYVQP